ncbi:MAG: hypothetical protein ABR548_13500 [Actinomycetota bacterium]|nr:hypothetical protein [Actinomycetota bacterium]
MDFLKRLLPRRAGWQAGLSTIFVAAGFIVIALAWNGAAGIDFTQGQIPYLLSGGAAGLGLIGVGIALMLFEASRRSSAHLDAQLAAIRENLLELRSPNMASRNGGGAIVPEGFVIAGPSSFHLPECRLVTGKDNQIVISAEEAASRGLLPCRVCQPELSEAETS